MVKLHCLFVFSYIHSCLWNYIINIVLILTKRKEQGTFSPGKPINITYYDYVFVTLVTGRQCACSVLSYDACPAVQCVSYYLIKGKILIKEITEYKIYFHCL